MFSGYRAMSRRFVKSFPAEARGFEIETELTVHALELRVPTAEVVTSYFERPEGSTSKLSTYRDGMRILYTMARLFRDVRPLPFFFGFAILFALAGLVLGAEVVVEYLETGLVPRLPTAVLATGLMLLASLAVVCGMILDSVARGRRETKRLAYLAAAARQELAAARCVALPAKGRELEHDLAVALRDTASRRRASPSAACAATPRSAQRGRR